MGAGLLEGGLGFETPEGRRITQVKAPRGLVTARGPSPNIRGATPADLERIVAIENASYAVPWSPEAFRSLFERGGVRFLVAEDGSDLVGYAVSWEVAEEAELGNLAVSPHLRRQGVGAALLDRMIDDLARAGVRYLFLEVRWSNEAALRLYASRGFEQVALRKRYYERPREHARVLRLALPPKSKPVEKRGMTHFPIDRG
jgi:ribosomal-protein-alanine N-acetyltransferase